MLGHTLSNDDNLLGFRLHNDEYLKDFNVGYKYGKVYTGLKVSDEELECFLTKFVYVDGIMHRYVINEDDYKIIVLYQDAGSASFRSRALLVYKDGEINIVYNTQFVENSVDIEYSIEKGTYLEKLVTLSNNNYNALYNILNEQKIEIVDYSDTHLVLMATIRECKYSTNEIYYVFSRDRGKFITKYVLKISGTVKLNFGISKLICGVDLITGKMVKLLLHNTSKGYLTVEELERTVKTINKNTSVNFRAAYYNNNLNVYYSTNKKTVSILTEDKLSLKGVTRCTWGDI